MMKMLLGVVLALSCTGLAQDTRQPVTTSSEVGVAKLSPPIYPPLALQARITGTVELNVTLRRDGSVESVAVVSGHPNVTLPSIVHDTRNGNAQGTARPK